MAINLPIVTQFSDKGLKSAKAAFANFKTDVSAATGAMGKFKAGGNAALNAVKANAGNFAMAAGGAIASFAVKAVGEFQDLALASGKFADATGLSVEEASRFKEVGDDIGIGADAIEGAIGKMNKTLGASPELFAELGVDVVKTETGLTDVNGTFLAVIGRLKAIKDPAERARVGAQLLGKGWAEMAQFVEMGSYELSKALEDVSDAKVIDSEEVEKAKKFRDVMDDLKDKVEALSLTLGETLVPVLSEIGEVVKAVVNVRDAFKSIPGVTFLTENLQPLSLLKKGFNGVKGAASAVFGLFSDEKKVIPVFAKELRDAREDQDLLNQSLKELKDGGLKGFVSGFDDAAKAIASATSEWQILIGALDTQKALDNVEGQLADLEAAAARAFATGAESDIAKYIEKQLEFVTGLSSIAEGMDTISSKEILMAFQLSGSQAAIDLARWLASGGELSGLSVFDLLTMAGIPGGARANGGPVSGNTSYLVGEKGPEIFTPSSSGMITPNSAIGGGGNTLIVNVQGADPQAVVKALQDYNRTAGPIPVNTRAN